MATQKDITARKESCGKVMFLHLSVSHSVYMGGGGAMMSLSAMASTTPWMAPSQDGTPSPQDDTPQTQPTSGWYASYWNDFLLFCVLTVLLIVYFQGLAKQTDWSIRQIERWWRRRRVQGKASEMTRFKETSWRFVVYLFLFYYGLAVLWNASSCPTLCSCFKSKSSHVAINKTWNKGVES